MKYIIQFLIIITITMIGEILKQIIPIPIPGNIYGLIILFLLLYLKILKVSDIKDVSNFLLEIMPIMFIAVAANLINLWTDLKQLIIALIIIIPVTTVLVFVSTGKISDFLIERRKNG